MPDTSPESTAERIMDKIMRWAGPIILAYLATLATRNTVKNDTIEDKVGKVQEVQQQTAETATEVKQDLKTRADSLDKETAKQREMTAANLYGTFKYLEGVAVSPEEVKRAADAKKLWEEFTKNGKK